VEDDRHDTSVDRGIRGRDAALLEDDRDISSEATIGITGSAAAALALVTSYSVARYESRVFPSIGIGGIDIHKADRPMRAEMGGLAVLVALAVGSIAYLVVDFAMKGETVLFAAVASTVALTGVVGIADDMVELSQKFKPFLIVAASIPLMAYLWGRGGIFVPTIGYVDFGILYPLVAVPLAITTSANFSNLLAGFNGLESGCAVISIGTMSYLSWITGHPTVAAFGVILTSAFLGFLVLNWYPAKIFPGDTGTLLAGAALAAIGLASGLEFEAVVLSIPAAMDFALKMMHRRPFKQRHLLGNTKVRPDGTLDPAPYPALVHAFMRVSPIKERDLVLSVLAMQALFALSATIILLRFG
jgi:UDP-N-acetylglucosamine--dolichyl-phosphate N-acetylglucosaminephosphotransferase